MKANKISCYIIGALIEVSLIGSILFTVFECGWWTSFSFAILGSCIVSFLTCWINYVCIRKDTVVRIVHAVYSINLKANTALYSMGKDLTLIGFQNVIEIALGEAQIDYWLTIEMRMGLFVFSPRKKKIDELELMLKNLLFELQEIAFYIEKMQENAEQSKKDIYQALDTLIGGTKLYKYSLCIAKQYVKRIYSFEECEAAEELKWKAAEEMRKKINKR